MVRHDVDAGGKEKDKTGSDLLNSDRRPSRAFVGTPYGLNVRREPPHSTAPALFSGIAEWGRQAGRPARPSGSLAPSTAGGAGRGRDNAGAVERRKTATKRNKTKRVWVGNGIKITSGFNWKSLSNRFENSRCNNYHSERLHVSPDSTPRVRIFLFIFVNFVPREAVSRGIIFLRINYASIQSFN